jgi:hypothetical protein
MDFGRLAQVWRERWALTASLSVLVLAGFFGSLAIVPSTYQSQATVILLASKAESGLYGGNPYLSFSPSLSLAADAVSRAVMSPATARNLASQGYGASYTVAPPAYATSTTGSVLVVTTTGRDRLDVQDTLLAVLSDISKELAVVQGRVRPKDQIRVTTLAVSPQATLSVGHTARPLVAIGALGLLAVLGIPVLVDSRSQRRGRRELASRPARFTPQAERQGVRP